MWIVALHLVAVFLVIGCIFFAARWSEQRKETRYWKQLFINLSEADAADAIQDRFAERAMQVLMKEHNIRADSRDMDLKLVADGAYTMSDFMLVARRSK